MCSSQTNPRIDLKDFFFFFFFFSPVTYGQVHIHRDFEEKLFQFIQYFFLLILNFKNLANCLFFYVLNYYVESFSSSISLFDSLFTVNTCAVRSTKVRHLNKVTAAFSMLITVFPYILTGRSTEI